MKNDLGSQKTERTIGNQLGALQKIKESFENAMTCCKNTKLSLKTHFAFKKAYKLQWKNAHSTVLQNAWSQKTNTFVEKQN